MPLHCHEAFHCGLAALKILGGSVTPSQVLVGVAGKLYFIVQPGGAISGYA